jgi:hypothetical protein
MENHIFPGSLTAAYTDTQYSTNGLTPRVGDTFYNQSNGKKYIFLKNAGATAITAQLVATATTTQKSAFTCSLAAATDALQSFAGVRVASATSLAQNEYGWFQIGGSATFLHSGGAAVAADEGIVTSATVAGKVEGAAATAVADASFAFAEAAKTTLNEVVTGNIVRNVWGV